MSDLTSDGKALVRAGRQADRPSDADRQRVLAALQARLGDAALLATGPAEAPPPPAAVPRSKFVRWGWVGPAVLVGGALLFVPRLWHGDVKAVPAPSASALSVPPTPAVVSTAAEAVSSAPEVAAPSPSAGPGPSRGADSQKAPRTRDSLTEEVALLSRAETELRAGQPAKALVVLSEHQRKFPRGALAEERTA
ncbi:MAG TPA: hypothetical protein VGJ91_08890, partial [Polyangiaceae bacterium]